MRNYLKKLNIWQQKRNSLPIIDDYQLDWMEMEAILNKEMPQNEHEKQVFLIPPPKKLNLLSLMLVSFSAAAMTLVVTHVVKTNNIKSETNHTTHHKKHHKILDSVDLKSTNNNLNTDTMLFESTLKSYLLINATESAGEVKLEKITDAIALNSSPLPLVSNWQKTIDINTNNSLKVSTTIERKHIDSVGLSNKIGNSALPLFNNTILRLTPQSITKNFNKQFKTENNLPVDSLLISKTTISQGKKELLNTNLLNTTNNKTSAHLSKINLVNIPFTIKKSPLPVVGGKVTSSKAIQFSGVSAGNASTKANIAVIKNSTKSSKNRINQTLDTTKSNQALNKDTNNSILSASPTRHLSKNNKKYLSKISISNVLNNPNVVSKKSASYSLTKKAATSIDSMASSGKKEEENEPKIDSNLMVNKNTLTPNNKTNYNKKARSKLLLSLPLYSSNKVKVNNIKLPGYTPKNNQSSKTSTNENTIVDTILRPNSTSKKVNLNKKNKLLNNKKNLGGTKTKAEFGENRLDDDNNALSNTLQANVIKSYSGIPSETIVQDQLFYGNSAYFYFNPSNLLSIGKPLFLNLKTDNNNEIPNEEEEFEAEIKTAKVLTLLDYGLLFGLNNPDSFYSYNQGLNSNGSLPISPYFGAFVNFNLHNKWSLSSQIRFLVPRNNTVDYNIYKQFSADSAQQLKVNNTRKIYSLDLPLHLVYRLNRSISFYAGPTISIPLMQINVNNRLQTDTIKSGIATYSPYSNIADNSFFSRKLSFGISAGANYQFDRYYIGFMWDKSLTGYQINSSYGNSNSFLSSFQLSFGISLKKPKNK